MKVSPSLDGFEIVDTSDESVVDLGTPLPIYLPKKIALPTEGWKFYIEGDDLYITQTDISEKLLALSLIPVGSFSWLAGMSVLAFVGASAITYYLSRRFLRNYFALSTIQVPTLAEALQSGEGQKVEFKRGFSADSTKTTSVDEEILKSIAAFANTNEGVIFIGVDNTGHITGLELDFKKRDLLEQKIRELARSRIKPTPPFQISFEDVRGFTIAKITVVRGEAPAYIIGGVIYIRYGSTDVQAQPEDLTRIIAEYAL